MIIIKNKQYQKSYKKYILEKNRVKEMENIEKIESVIINSKNLQALINSPYKNIYHIEQKKGNLKKYYTARINGKLRIVMIPCGEYPYNAIEIEKIEFLDIDTTHYGEG